MSDTVTAVEDVMPPQPEVVQQTAPIQRHVSRSKRKADKDQVEAVAGGLLFTCVRYPELRFQVEKQVFTDDYGRQRSIRRGRFARFTNGRFLARSPEEIAYCRGKPWIYEEPTDDKRKQTWKCLDPKNGAVVMVTGVEKAFEEHTRIANT